MPNLTKSSAKKHCRTCLIKLNLEDTKDCRNLSENLGLRSIIDKYIECKDEEQDETSYPRHVCLGCFDKLQEIHNFLQQVQEITKKLNEIVCHTSGNEMDDGDNSRDIYKLLLKDTLMETESVLLQDPPPSSPRAYTNPDPFSSNIDSTNNKENTKIATHGSEMEKSENEDREWANNSSSDGESDKDLRRKLCKSEDCSNTELENNLKPATRSCAKLAKNVEALTVTMKRKKRRTKKEMQEFRRKQLETEENKNKRRQKGTKNNFKCSKCNHCFAHKITLDAHVRKIHEGNKRPFCCDRCDKSYTFIGGLYTHIKEIHEAEVRSYACDFPNCDRMYTSFIAMQKHKRLKHTDTPEQKKYVCEQCGATFNQTGNLKYHRRTKHPTEDEKAEKEREKERYECTICKKLFHSRYTLKYHTLQLHTNETKYECNVCGRKMAKKFMLVQHMLVHSTEKMPCEHCGKQFIRKFELEAHIKAVHMKLKPFECQFCLECFASRKTLRHHEYIHTGEKPYVCDLCGQAYRQQTCLKNHRKSHEKVETDGNGRVLSSKIKQNLMSAVVTDGIDPELTSMKLKSAESIVS